MQESYKVANATQNTQFKVGQTVWCLLYGKGEVSDVDGSVEVNFGWTAELYTFEGVHTGSSESTMGHYTKRTLFHSEPQVIAATEPVFEPKLVGKVVLVKNLGGEEVGFGYVEDESESSILIDNCSYLKCMYNFYEPKDQPISFD